VAIITVLAVVIAGVTVQRAGATYSSTAEILVTPLPEGSSGFAGIGTVVDTGDPARTVQTAAALIDTANAGQLTAKELGPGWTTGRVMSAVSVTPEGASDVLSVTGTASAPGVAKRLANAFAKNAISYRARVVQTEIANALSAIDLRLVQLQRQHAGGSAEAAADATAAEQLKAVQGTGNEPTMSVSQTAQNPAGSNGTSHVLILLLALIGGFALGSVAALGLETFSRPVRDREELESLFPIPVLAALPLVHGRRAREGVPPWVLPPDGFEQLRMLRVQLSLSRGGHVIMVSSAGAGDGKTTVTAALAAAFAEAGQSVILMDLDLRKPDLRRLLQVDTANGASGKVATPGVPLPVPNLPGIQVLPTPQGDITAVEGVVQRLPLLISQARRAADIVIIDTAPVGEVSEALRIAGMCDQVVFVARPRHTDRRRLALARDLLDRAGTTPVGMVVVGKETGLPRGDQHYAYAIGAMKNSGSTNGVAHRASVSGAIVTGQRGVGNGIEHD
jgi:Mrp family chromosome partitioning ATPase